MKNRLTPYAAGWLTLLVSMGVATEAEVLEARRRVALAVIDELERRRKKKRKKQ